MYGGRELSEVATPNMPQWYVSRFKWSFLRIQVTAACQDWPFE